MDETSMTGVANMQNRQARPLSPCPFRVPPLTCAHSAPKIFNDDKDASFVKYVHTLKAAVGIQALVEVVVIGKGERDLTGIATQPVRKIQATTHPEIPVVKECSSLTYREIFEFLNGNTRLSKALSNNIFWGAVWPHLLARGWHLELPEHLSFVGSKHAFLFLVPGVKEFSGKKLEKGTHYFDFVHDVRNEVAADPRIIGLDDEGEKGGSDTKDDCGSDTDARLDQNGLPDHQGHCYLQPRLSDCSSEPTMFTIVDTSLVQGEDMATEEFTWEQPLPVFLKQEVSTQKNRRAQLIINYKILNWLPQLRIVGALSASQLCLRTRGTFLWIPRQ